VGSFAALCLAGAGLLMLPASIPRNGHIYYIDALFTATSATCVTGLIVRDTAHDFTRFGQAVILGLIQFGGLGIMIFGTVLGLVFGRGLSLRGSHVMGHMLSMEAVGRIGRTILFVIVATLAIEAAGAILLYPMFDSLQGAPGAEAVNSKAAWDSVFHAVSAFCNAGFTLYKDNLAEGVRQGWSRALRDHWQTLGVIGSLIVLGGLGFPVLQDAAAWMAAAVRRTRQTLRRRLLRPAFNRPRPRLSLHSRLVLTATALLILGGTTGLLLVEPPSQYKRNVVGRTPLTGPASEDRSDWPRLSLARRIREATFQSITARTAGFNTFDTTELSNAGKMWMCGLMIIGGSPAGTAGGMKTTTVALLLIAAYSMIRQRSELEAYRRSISVAAFRRAVTLALLYLGLVAASTLLVSMALRSEPFIDVLFEACSACGTVGLSTGTTTRLNVPGKSVIIAAMFAGRVGPLTLAVALTSGLRPAKYAYPTESVLIG